MGSDPTSIWERSGGRVRRPASPLPSSPPAASAAAPQRTPARPSGTPPRLSLKDASRRFGVSLATLRAWCRAGEVDAVMEGGRWMVAPASVTARKRRTAGGARRGAGPTPEGNAMLVPRDAWDRLLAQLGHLHEAGQQLAEARERAAKAETEATFLRERLAEMRAERDGLRQRLDDADNAHAGEQHPSLPRLLGSRLLGSRFRRRPPTS